MNLGFKVILTLKIIDTPMNLENIYSKLFCYFIAFETQNVIGNKASDECFSIFIYN